MLDLSFSSTFSGSPSEDSCHASSQTGKEMQRQHGIIEKVKASITTMLTLAAPQGDGLYKELAGK
ncbi:hypothetical protein A6R68_01431 [Neotoma lepida]|uniref:Uncharacterized protein n=1 Tax=Neotoma lepida TaxID=56216 RepID=A0A1A6GUL5_NEOLE|nr:hypothetical protein A6R68_01431 [Neotoma lepida]